MSSHGQGIVPSSLTISSGEELELAWKQTQGH